MNLTHQEIEILKLTAFGYTNIEIGDELGLSRRTVEMYSASILSKMEAKSKAHAVYIAMKNKIIKMKSTIKSSCWFTTGTGTTIGIILVDSFDEEKAYIGDASGKDESADITFIYHHGAKFPVESAKELMKLKGMPCNIEV